MKSDTVGDQRAIIRQETIVSAFAQLPALCCRAP